MVLGFGSKKKKPSAEPLFVRASPSLPELAQQRIPWPADLLASNVVDYPPPPHSEGHGGPRKTSFQGARGPAIPFHKPFRGGADTPTTPPSAFSAGARRSQRRTKAPPTFNVMVAGAKQTGKSSLLRLLLDTSAVAPTNPAAQLAALAAFRAAAARPTGAIAAASVEILLHGAPDDRVVLTCIDTPGLDFAPGKELALDRAVSGVVRYVDAQFAETLGEESKVVRASSGDRHVHVCLYMIDPAAVMTPAARRARARHTAAGDPAEPSEYDSGTDDEDEDDAAPAAGGHSDDNDEYGAPEAQLQTPPHSQGSPRAHNRLALAPAEVRVVARLAQRVTVLPVVARADTLTDGRLARVKRAVRRDLGAAGVFALWDAEPGARAAEDAAAAAAEEARPVIKLRERGLTRSRSRRSLKSVVGAEYDAEAPAAESRRTSVGSAAAAAAAHETVFSREELRGRIPFAVIAPERERGAGTAASSQHGHGHGHGPAGRFVRRFRWGTVDVLDPQHCDFAALRTAVLGSYMRVLRATTKDVLYERYRTEKLLARRATRDITADDRKRILHDLGL